jgi:hypothetical protein
MASVPYSQITDLHQKSLIRGRIECRTAMLTMPVIDLVLQGSALVQQSLVRRDQVANQVGQSFPERLGGNPRAGQHFRVDKVVQLGRDADVGDLQRFVRGPGWMIHGRESAVR